MTDPIETPAQILSKALGSDIAGGVAHGFLSEGTEKATRDWIAHISAGTTRGTGLVLEVMKVIKGIPGLAAIGMGAGGLLRTFIDRVPDHLMDRNTKFVAKNVLPHLVYGLTSGISDSDFENQIKEKLGEEQEKHFAGKQDPVVIISGMIYKPVLDESDPEGVARDSRGRAKVLDREVQIHRDAHDRANPPRKTTKSGGKGKPAVTEVVADPGESWTVLPSLEDALTAGFKVSDSYAGWEAARRTASAGGARTKKDFISRLADPQAAAVYVELVRFSEQDPRGEYGRDILQDPLGKPDMDLSVVRMGLKSLYQRLESEDVINDDGVFVKPIPFRDYREGVHFIRTNPDADLEVATRFQKIWIDLKEAWNNPHPIMRKAWHAVLAVFVAILFSIEAYLYGIAAPIPTFDGLLALTVSLSVLVWTFIRTPTRPVSSGEPETPPDSQIVWWRVILQIGISVLLFAHAVWFTTWIGFSGHGIAFIWWSTIFMILITLCFKPIEGALRTLDLNLMPGSWLEQKGWLTRVGRNLVSYIGVFGILAMFSHTFAIQFKVDDWLFRGPGLGIASIGVLAYYMLARQNGGNRYLMVTSFNSARFIRWAGVVGAVVYFGYITFVFQPFMQVKNWPVAVKGQTIQVEGKPEQILVVELPNGSFIPARHIFGPSRMPAITRAYQGQFTADPALTSAKDALQAARKELEDAKAASSDARAKADKAASDATAAGQKARAEQDPAKKAELEAEAETLRSEAETAETVAAAFAKAADQKVTALAEAEKAYQRLKSVKVDERPMLVRLPYGSSIDMGAGYTVEERIRTVDEDGTERSLPIGDPETYAGQVSFVVTERPFPFYSHFEETYVPADGGTLNQGESNAEWTGFANTLLTILFIVLLVFGTGFVIWMFAEKKSGRAIALLGLVALVSVGGYLGWKMNRSFESGVPPPTVASGPTLEEAQKQTADASIRGLKAPGAHPPLPPRSRNTPKPNGNGKKASKAKKKTAKKAKASKMCEDKRLSLRSRLRLGCPKT